MTITRKTEHLLEPVTGVAIQVDYSFESRTEYFEDNVWPFYIDELQQIHSIKLAVDGGTDIELLPFLSKQQLETIGDALSYETETVC